MGIRGLTTYIEEYYSDKLKNITPRGPLVIDALSLCYLIYNGVDWLHGGQYWELRQRFTYLFTCLLRSDIDPIVVFDGVDFTGNKSPVIEQRMEESDKCIAGSLLRMEASSFDDEQRLPPSSRNNGSSVIPQFSEKVFVETLRELHIPFLYADGDADEDCVSIANYNHCPVVSNDSDYFMFNLEVGYIPFDKFYYQNKPVTAKMYRLDDFVADYRFRDFKLPLLIPAIMGNDYIEKEEPHSLKKDVPALRKQSPREIPYVDRTHHLIRYLSSFRSIDDFKEHITKEWEKDDQEALIDNFDIAEEMYIVKPMSIEDYMTQTNLKTANETPLPRWLLCQYREGLFSSSAMMVLVGNGISLSPVIENPKCSKPALIISRDLRSCLYRIMEPFLKEEIVGESIRFHSEWFTEDVIPASASLRLPSIVKMESLSTCKRIEALCRAMECPPRSLDSFENKWKLPVLSLCYWIAKARPSMDMINSLIVCHLICSRGDNPLFMIPRTSSSRPRHKQWLEMLHTFTMWQCIYKDAMKINNVLMNPLHFRTPALLFDGKLAMHFATTRDWVEVLKQRSSPRERQLYDTFMSVVTTYMSNIKSKPKAKSGASGRSKVVSPPKVKPSASVISTCNRFSALALDDDNTSSSSQDDEECFQ